MSIDSQLPLALPAAKVYLFTTLGDALCGPSAIPPDARGKIDIERMSFRPQGIEVQVINTGPVELTISQVTVNDHLWTFSVAPDSTILRLGSATVTIPYPWLQGEPHAVKLIASNGLAFLKAVSAAAPAPEPSPSFSLMFVLLGVYVGVVSILLGLL